MVVLPPRGLTWRMSEAAANRAEHEPAPPLPDHAVRREREHLSRGSQTEATEPPRRCLILANPRAGALQMQDLYARLLGFGRRPAAEAGPPLILETLAEQAAAAGLDADVEPAPLPHELPARIRAAERGGFDTIVAVGGDGTARTIAQSLVGSALRLGILPLGTANNFAHSLGIPLNLEGALQTLATGVERRVDVGRIGPEYFLEAAGVGLFADAVLGFGASEPRKHEIWRVLRTCGPLCWRPAARTLRLTLDGETQVEETLLVTIANSAYLGAGMPMAPDAGMDDGMFDVVIAEAMTRWEVIRFGEALMRGRHLELPKVHRRRARVVEIRRVHRAHHPLPVHADDHIAGFTPVRLEVIPRSLGVIVPV